MPRYFFHTTDGTVSRDNEGTVLPDIQAARWAAVRFVGSSLVEYPEKLWEGLDLKLEVTNEDHKLLFTILTLAIDTPVASEG